MGHRAIFYCKVKKHFRKMDIDHYVNKLNEKNVHFANSEIIGLSAIFVKIFRFFDHIKKKTKIFKYF